MTPNFVVVVNVLIPLCRHIGLGTPNLHIFVEEIVTLLDAMGVKTFLWSELENKQ